jgi:hypothetical protein
VDVAGRTLPHTHTSSGQDSAPIVIEARTAATGRSKNGSRLPSDSISPGRHVRSDARQHADDDADDVSPRRLPIR